MVERRQNTNNFYLHIYLYFFCFQTVPLCFSLIKDVAKLELAVNKVAKLLKISFILNTV